MDIVQIHNVGLGGINRDQPPHTLPPEVWTNGKNVRFNKKGVSNIPGETTVFGTPSVAPIFMLPVPTASIAYWIYGSKTKLYVYEGGVHSNITRQTLGVDVDYTTLNTEDWGGTLLGGVPIFNNNADVPQYWAAYNPAQKLQALPNWPTDLRAKIVKAFGQYLVAMNLLDGTSSYPHAIQWSHRADPGSVPTSWDVSDPTVDAGRRELTDVLGGPIFDGLMLGNAMIIYKASSTHSMRYVGGQELFVTDLLLASSGILATKCACPILEGRKHFVVTDSDVVIHSGQKDVESVIDDVNREYLFNNLDLANASKSYTFDNPRYSEAWFAYPANGAEFVNSAAIYNYKKQTWTFRDFTFAAAEFGLVAESGSSTWDDAIGIWDTDTEPWSRVGQRGIILANDQQTLLQRLDSGHEINGSTPTASIERIGLAIIGKDRQGAPKVDYRVVKQVNRLIPKLVGSGVIKIEVGAQDDFNAPIIWSSAQEFRIGVDKYVDFNKPAVGKLIGVRFTSTSTDAWRLEGYDLELSLLGNM